MPQSKQVSEAELLHITAGTLHYSTVTRLLKERDDLLAAGKKASIQYKEDIEACGPCDHSVGICICGLIRDAEELERLITETEKDL